jgi:hypothetical protein
MLIHHASSTVILMRRVVVIPVRARAITPFSPRSRRRSRSSRPWSVSTSLIIAPGSVVCRG